MREVREGHAAGEGEGLARPRLEGCQMQLRLKDVHEGEAPASQTGEGDMTMAKGNPNMGGRGLYLVLGCGDVGFAIASRLKCRCTEVAVIERNADKVEALRWNGYSAFCGDFSSTEVLKRAGMERADAVIITARDFPTIKRALNAIGQLKAQLGISPLVLALVSDEVEVPEAKSLGANVVLPSSQILADFALGRLEELKTKTQSKRNSLS